MAEREVPVDIRIKIVKWPDDAPRGAVSQFCRQAGISRSRFYEIRALARSAGLIAAVTRGSRAPLRSPARTSAEMEDLLVWARKRLADEGKDCGPISIRDYLIDHGLGTPPSRATIARVLNRRGQVVPEPLKRPRASYRRFVYPRPNDMWASDGFCWYLVDGTAVCILQITDDHSRRELATHATSGETTDAIWGAISAAIAIAGVPTRFLSDNGAAFNPERRGRIGVIPNRLRALGVRPISTSVGHPQTNGKNERAHQPLQRWLRARPDARTLAELQTLLDEYNDWYNNQRRNQGLPKIGSQHMTPIQAWNDTEPAPPPEPPATPPRHAPNQPPRHLLVGDNGKVMTSISNLAITIYVDRESAGMQVIMLIDDNTIDIFDTEGTHIRTVELDDRTYYGKEPQTPPKTKLSGMS